MAAYTSNTLLFISKTHPLNNNYFSSTHSPFLAPTFPQQPKTFSPYKSNYFRPMLLSVTNASEVNMLQEYKKRRKFRWPEIGPNNLTEEEKMAISKLPPKMTNRCKAVMRQLICFFGSQKGQFSLSDLLGGWVWTMKPRRTDWLSVLKQLKLMEHPLYSQVTEFALLEESFEANVRDFTKIIHYYGKHNQLQDAENALLAMKRRGLVFDQVTLTAMIDLYSKAGNLKLAEETFEDIKLLGQSLDKRAYGSMIMAYIRAGIPEKGELLLKEIYTREIRAGSEVYKALLRAYSMAGNSDGAQRVFNAIQFAGIPPDVRMCGLLINAYKLAGQSQKAYVAFENMKKAGLVPDDRCIALVLGAFEKDNQLNKAMNFLIDLEREGIVIGKEASEVTVAWFRRLGVVKEVGLVLREYAATESN